MELDVCDETAVENSVKKTVESFGRIDVGVNVAGIAGTPGLTADMEEERWRKVIDINLNGVWRSHKSELKAMVQQE
jgi:NAD(P)-dependent dehydrogenase (short-subunit alcohol dehydrogenase family)